jgi:hypothetical protein
MNHKKNFSGMYWLAGLVLLLGNSVFAQTNLVLNKPSVANSWDTAGVGGGSRGMPASLAVDGDPGTRWGTDWINDVNRDSGWIYVDLGASQSISSVVIQWETAGAVHYAIQVANFTDPLSSDTSALLATDDPWATVAEITDGTSEETRVINFAQTTAHQIRIRAYTRTTMFGYSIWDWKCFAQPTVVSTSVLTTKALSPAKTILTQSEIKFFGPDITSCKLYDLAGRCLLNVNQAAAPLLSLNVSTLRGNVVNGAVFVKLVSKNGTSTQKLTIVR